MVFLRILSILWKMLSIRRRIAFLGLSVLLFVAGVMELLGMLTLFGYIQGLHFDEATGQRAGRLARGIQVFYHEALGPVEYAIWGGVILVGVMLLKNLLGTLVRFLLTRFLTKLNHRICTGLFEGYMRAPYERLKGGRLGNPEGTVGETFDVFSSCFQATAQVLADGSLVAMIIGLLLFVDPWMTLGAAAIFLFVGTVLYRMMEGQLVEMGRRESRARMKSKRYLRDAVTGVIEARLRGVTGFFVARFGSSLRETTLLQRRKRALSRMPRAWNEVLLALVVASAVLYLTFSGSSVQAALPTLALFGFAGLRFSSTVSRINASLQHLRQKLESFDRCYNSVLRVAPHLFSDADPRPENDYLKDEEPLPEGVDGRLHECLEFENVSFSYVDREEPAIDDVSLTVRRGSFTAFCGPSGGGKSTLLLLLMGLVRPSAGSIKCDGRDIFKFIRAWHKNIGYVGQQVFIASASIRENVAFGLPKTAIDNARVWKALKQAAADKFVRQLPKKLSEPLADGGANLSGGQRQRISIARALYHDPEVIVFDEATAALDNVTEREITDSLMRLSGNKTVVCVAHRLTTIRHSDRIYFIDQGKVKAAGSYDELLATSPEFRRMAHTLTERGSDAVEAKDALPARADAL